MTGAKPIAVLDTDVVSYMMKGAPIGWEYYKLVAGYQPSVAFVTAAELHYGAQRRGWGPRRQLQLDLFLAGCSILPFKSGMEHLFAKIMTDRERMGKRMERSDAWIATTAIYHDLPLVTHDGDFADTRGLRIITASTEARAAQRRLPVVGRHPLNLDMRCQCGL